jgi:hypothetical protein
VNLQSYFATAELASLDEGELPGLIPFLIGRPLCDEVAIIATIAGRPFMLRTVPLSSLGDELACGIAAAYWAHTGVDCIWLIGHGTEGNHAVAAIEGLAAAFAPRGWCDQHRLIHIDPKGRNWRYVHEDDELDWGPISAPDPLTGALAALAFHTTRVATSEAEALAPPRSSRVREANAETQSHMELLREATGDRTELAEADRAALGHALTTEATSLRPDTVISLGVVLATDPALMRCALAHIWESPTDAGSGTWLWIAIAKHTTGTARAVACALAALATWRFEDPLAPIAAREALTADPHCPIAIAASTIVTSGALAANFEGNDEFTYLADPAHIGFDSETANGAVA